MEPLEYCRKWVAVSPEQRGWRKASIAALMKATGLNESTISNWGKDFERRPDSVLRTLDLADKLNTIRQILLDLDL